MGPTTRTFQAASTRPVRSIGTLREELHFIDKRILTQLQPYDLCDRVLSKEPRIVGKGTFSDVFRGICRDTENRQVKVAMKRLRLHVNAEECKRLFEKEIYVWSKLIHANILPLLGFAFDADTGYPILISEWLDNGNAFAYVRGHNHPADRILEIIYDSAKGLEYLHDEERAVIHSDIKPENIVINPYGVAMLCDFGCARTQVATHSIAKPSEAIKGTCNYWAPELLRRQNDVLSAHTMETDVWAFGMTIYALLTKDVPFKLYLDFGVPLAIMRGELPLYPDDQSEQEGAILLRRISQKCWDAIPSNRPKASFIVDELRTNGSANSKNSSNGKHSHWNSQTSVPKASSSGSTLESGSPNRGQDEANSFSIPTLPPTTFSQTPLVSTDLKTTTIDVAGSHIRANDKGNKVLSFIITVQVVGKEAWQIEKFYSDVLALDNRLRSMCSRSTLKKLEPLPDNKLFKDHAPAKVVQRKRMLRGYLQSAINLPLKDKNDIVVFFSSDIIRKLSPVTRNGYKEGYLTKRGKNFGGWKTRYFVLQGPVLEYFQNQGGTYLGSIQITGAQIGRQQNGGYDDDNEYRHALLIIEQRKRHARARQNTRHVLCAESERERDAWVDVLVKYVIGSYDNAYDRLLAADAAPMMQARTSISSEDAQQASSLLVNSELSDSNPKLYPFNQRSNSERGHYSDRLQEHLVRETTRAVFGVPLEEALAVSQVANLPSIVFRCIQFLELNKADEEEGIYRLIGSLAVIKNLKDRFNLEGDVDLEEADIRDPHAIAGLLKTFLRELPSSLLTRGLHMNFLAVMDFVDTDERVRELQLLISRLPLANYSLLRALTAHLIRIVQNSHVNKMTMRNVGIVFSPTLGIPAGVFSLMLGEFNRVFNVNGEGSDSTVDEEEAAPNARPRRSFDQLSRRNS